MKKLELSPPSRRTKRKKVSQPKRTVPISQEVAEPILAKAVEVYGTETIDSLRNTSVKGFKLARQAVVVALIEAGKRRDEKYSQGSIGEAVGFSTPSSVANAIRSTRKLKGEEKEMLEKVVSAVAVKTPDIAKLRNEVFGSRELPAGWKRTEVQASLEVSPLSAEDGVLYTVWRQGYTTVTEISLLTKRSETDVSVMLVRVAELLRRHREIERLVADLV